MRVINQRFSILSETESMIQVKGENMVVKETEKETEVEDVKRLKSSAPWPLITIGIVATVVVLALIIGGWAFISSQSQTQTSGAVGRFGQMNSGSNNQQMYGGSGGNMRARGGRAAAAASGVITAINGDTITVSGSGKQVTVMKTATTTISGDKTEIAVNDSVVVTGETASDGTVTATQIAIRNQQGFGRATSDSTDGSDQASGV